MHRKLSLKTEISVIFYPFYPKISDSLFLLCPNSSSERTNGILSKGNVRISKLYQKLAQISQSKVLTQNSALNNVLKFLWSSASLKRHIKFQHLYLNILK